MSLELTNVVTISVSTAPIGLGDYNVNNIALFTQETPVDDPGDYGVYVSPAAVAADWGSASEAYLQAVAIFSQTPNILNGGGNLIIAKSTAPELLEVAIARIAADIFFVGVLSQFEGADAAAQLVTATAIQAMGDKVWIFPQFESSAIAGVFTTLKDASLDKTRCILYTEDGDIEGARVMGAAYAGGGFATNFESSNATSTRNLKSLVGITPDSGITQTIYTAAETAGVDLYVNYAGVPAVASFGANKYFDQVYNLIWFVSQLQVLGFNALREVSTKVPQTEPGMTILKGAYRKVCEQGLTNAFLAPGEWNSSEWFGVQEDFDRNVRQRGYYIYSAPIADQLQATRDAREAPSIQIAIKEAGAIHSSIVNVLVEA